MPPDPEAPSLPTDLVSFVESAGRDLHRLIVVAPAVEGSASYLDSVFDVAGRPIPEGLVDWDEQVNAWCDEYSDAFGRDTAIVEVYLGSSVFVFDRTFERVIVAYGISTTPAADRDRNRTRRFPDVNVGVRVNLADDAFAADRGHFLAHGAGGDLDINLFPQRRELNRGWSPEGKTFRRMEAHVAARPGTFHAHRALYDDLTWIPNELEYAVLTDDRKWWVEHFTNK